MATHLVPDEDDVSHSSIQIRARDSINYILDERNELKTKSRHEEQQLPNLPTEITFIHHYSESFWPSIEDIE